MSKNNYQTGSAKSHTVIEALYELPLGGDWHDLQVALCEYWTSVGDKAPSDEISMLERHFSRALSFLEHQPTQKKRWINDLYRFPLATCVITGKGEIVDANKQGRALLGTDSHDIRLSHNNRQSIRRALAVLDEQNLAALTLETAAGSLLRMYLSKIPPSPDQESLLFLGVIVSKDLPTAGFELFAEQCGLTPSEVKLCLQLSGGASLDDVAKTSIAKKTTLRSHLSSCFSKLCVNSQPELVALILHHIFAGAHHGAVLEKPPRLTAYLDPEVHGFPKFVVIELSDGRNLGYFEYGDPDGIPAIYCHGSFETGMFAKSQRLSGNGVRLIAVERGGVGESTPGDDLSSEAYAQDLVELVDHLGFKEYTVIGRSMGSWDAISLALADSDRVKLLLFASCKLPVENASDHDDHLPMYRSLYNAIWHSKTMGRLILKVLQVQVMVRGAEHFMSAEGLTVLETKLLADPLHHRLMKANWMRSACHGADPINDHLKLYRDPVRNPPWRNLAIPTVLVHGTEDKNVPIERILSQTDSFVSRKVVLLEGMGHMVVHMALGEVLRVLNSAWEELALSQTGGFDTSENVLGAKS